MGIKLTIYGNVSNVIKVARLVGWEKSKMADLHLDMEGKVKKWYVSPPDCGVWYQLTDPYMHQLLMLAVCGKLEWGMLYTQRYAHIILSTEWVAGGFGEVITYLQTDIEKADLPLAVINAAAERIKE